MIKWPHLAMKSLDRLSLKFLAAWWFFEKKISKSGFSLVVGFFVFIDHRHISFANH